MAAVVAKKKQMPRGRGQGLGTQTGRPTEAGRKAASEGTWTAGLGELPCLSSLPLQPARPSTVLAMAPGEKIKAKIKKNLPVTGPQAPTVRELMRWYCLNTNTHGCRRIVVSRGRLRRLLWILFTLTAVALIFWQCALLVLSFYTVSVSIKVHFQKLDFPAVTICNINPYK